MNPKLMLLPVLLVGLTLGCTWAPAGEPPGRKGMAIVSPRDGSFAERLASREIRRYVYLRTGRLLPIVEATEVVPEGAGGIVVGRKDRAFVRTLLVDADLKSAVAGLGDQQYILKTVGPPGRRMVVIAGGDDLGTLFGAYRFAEHLGTRFYLHGDVIPDDRVDLVLPDIDDRGKPLFDLRGIQPFHDFPEGPDWWNLDDYKAIISQLPKLRMNFIGLHTYPEGGPNAEPTVWIGLPSEIGEGTGVKASYPSSYQNTLRGNWGYSAKKTGDFLHGASGLFEHDAYGSDPMIGMCPQPETPDAANEVFERTGTLLRRAFLHARSLGIKACAGTETPLTVPKWVKDRLEAAGKDPRNPAVVEELYEGIFRRAAQAYPLDYYWFWTPEGWTWQGASSEQVGSTIKDLKTAIAAWEKVRPPFELATCGWVLGPQDDRAMFDKVLPPGMAVSCINQQVGNSPVDPAFARVEKRPKWAIPWLEDDPGLTTPQLWVGRMRRDAADARRYGCTGLLGIHWRTRILAPNVSALAMAAWDQGEWNKTPDAPVEPPKVAGPVGGQVATFPNNPIADTDDDPLYQTVRYNVTAYRFPVPNGRYTVTLKFCEPHYTEAGKRVFSVKVEGKPVIEKLDIFATVGQNKALDHTFEEVKVTDGWLDIDFAHVVEFPCIAAISITSTHVSKKVNCGGSAYNDYAADWPVKAPAKGYLPTEDFYRDWACHEFGPDAGSLAGKIFEKLDGSLPRTSDWVGGPGGLKPDGRPWDEVEKGLTFVDEFAALRSKVKGAGNLERFDYWLRNFRYMKATGHLRCLWAEYNKAMEKVAAEKEAQAKADLARSEALPLRVKMVGLLGEVYEHLLGTTTNPGELGTVANWEQHILPSLLVKPGQELEKVIGEPLPANAHPGTTYGGPPRVIVPAVRTSVAPGEALSLKVIVLAGSKPREAALYWRPMGQGEFTKIPLAPAARGVYSAKLPALGGGGPDADLEYHVKVIAGDGPPVYFPPTAPAMNQTVVVTPPPLERF